MSKPRRPKSPDGPKITTLSEVVYLVRDVSTQWLSEHRESPEAPRVQELLRMIAEFEAAALAFAASKSRSSPTQEDL